MINEYQSRGFIVMPDVLSMDEVEALRQETVAIVRGKRGDIKGADRETSSNLGDDELLGTVLAIHFPHKVSDLMRSTLMDQRIIDTLRQLIGPDVKAMQSMLFVKQSGKPGQAWHQDEHFIPTRDRSLTGVWIALDDATIENGCLWMHPGSHKDGILWPMRSHHDGRFDGADEAYNFPFGAESGVPLEVKAGSVAYFNGYTLHRSLNNRRIGGYRRALVYHYMNARSLLPWSFGMPPVLRTDFRDIIMVAGHDPYAYKGLESISFPFVRPVDADQGRSLNIQP